MPNEIYHRSNWGESKAEDFGDVYYDHAATNKLYNHSDYYENSDGTDATLKDLNNKASIVLTPTAYSDGSLNTVIPPYGVLPTELVTNGTFDTDSDWSFNSRAVIEDGVAKFQESVGTFSQVRQNIGYTGQAKVTYTISFNNSSITTMQLRSYAGGMINVAIPATVGTHTLYVNFPSDGVRFQTGGLASDEEIHLDNVSVKEIQEADFDFSRGSSATRVNEQGLVEDVQILSGELVQNGDFEQIGSELVTNGNFDDGLNGWSSHSGSILELEDGRAKVTTVGSQGFIKRTDLSIQSGKIYFCTAQITNATIPQFYINGTSNVLNPMPLISGNTYGGYIKTTGNNSTFYIRGNNVDGQVSYIDNVSVKEVGQNWTFTNANISNGGVNISTSGDLAGIVQSSVTTSGRLYKFSIDITDIETLGQGISLVSGGLTSTILHTFTTVGTHTVNFTATSTTVGIKRKSGATDITIDNISVVEVTNDTDLPRIDFTDGTGSLLLEPQSTNLLQRSNEFDNSYWGKANVTVTPNSAISPDGTNNAFLIDVGTDNLEHSLRKTGLSPTATYTVSIFAKKGSTDYVWFLCGGSSRGVQAIFDLSDGSVTDSGTVGSGQTLVAAKSVDMGNGWYRLIMEAETTTPPANNLTITPYYQSTFSGNIGTSWQGNNETIYIYGAMNEENSFATSYTPTESASVTRSADVANNSGNADLFNDSEGVLYAEVAALADDNTGRRISISDNSSNPDNLVSIAISVYTDTIIGRVRSANTEVAFLTASSQTQTQNNKIAVLYKQNDFRLFINGTQVATDTSGSAPTGLVDLSFDRGNGSDDFYGKVKCVAVFKEALSNDLLERLTGEGYESFRLLAEANNYTII